VKSANTALALVVLCVPALAMDGDPVKPAPAPAPAPAPGGDGKAAPAPAAPAAPAAKKERKVDEAATKALERFVGMVHLPQNAGIKSIAGKGDVEQGGVTIGLNPTWSEEKGFDIEVTLPDAIKEQLAAQGMEDSQVTGMVKQQMGFSGVNSLFEAPGKNWSHFDVAFKQDGDDQVVDLTPFDDKADAESRKYVFGKDGLLKLSSMSPKVDPDNPMSAQMAGMTFDSTIKFEKKGERYLTSSRTLSIMGMEIETSFTYYDGPGGTFLPKEVTTSSPQGEQVIHFHDYTVDGKLVESTKAEAPKPAEKPAEKPAAKPADKPAGDPAPAPVPVPAPKDDPK